MPFQVDEGEWPGLLRFEPWDDIPWLVHAFTTRAAGSFSSEYAEHALPPPLSAVPMPLRLLRQVHSNHLHLAKATADPTPSWKRPEADGLLTSQAGHLLGVRTADCLPLLYVDRDRRAVAAVHAGWRGTAKGIAARAVERMRQEFGSPPDDLEVAMGPGIGPCCYEVGSEVADQFASFAIHKGPKPRLNLLEANRVQLMESGVNESRVWIAGMCTACSADQFYSHRREGTKAGRMLAVIGIRR